MAMSTKLIASYPTYDVYDVTLFGNRIFTRVTRTASAVTSWISAVESNNSLRLQELVVGLDIEWRPTFGPGPRNPVATLQLCVGSDCLIFQLIWAKGMIPTSLVNFLSNPKYTFVGVGIKDDVEKLRIDYGLNVWKEVDVRDLAEVRYGINHEFKKMGLVKLASCLLGLNVDKSERIRVSEWDVPWLSDGQVEYGCLDAFLSYEIGKFLNAATYQQSFCVSAWAV